MAATDIERLVVQIEGQTAKFDKALARMEGRSAASAKKVERTFAGMQTRLNSSFAAVGSSFKGALAIAGIGLGTSSILQYVDAWTKASNSLKVAGLSGAELTSTLDALYAAAQRQGAPLEAMTSLYGRAAAAQKELKATSGELVQFTEDVATALRVAGTSPDEASGALLQLGQLLGSARVQAEEFNSVNEAARPVLQAVANGIQEAGGSVSKLKQLVTDGKISNVAFFKGFQVGAQTIRDQAASAEPTVSQAFTRMQNAIIKMVGEVDKATGFSRSFVSDLDAMASGAKRAEGPLQFLVDVLRKLNELQDYANKNGLQLGVKLNNAMYGPSGASRDDLLRSAMAGYNPADTQRTSQEYDAALGFKNPSPPQKPIRAADYPVVGAKTKGGGDSETQYASETRQLHERTQALELEAATMGKSTYEVERAKTAMDLLNAAKSDGTKITPEVLAGINAEAEAYARAAQKVEQAKESYKLVQEVQDGLASSFSGAVSAIRQGESAIDALADSLGRLLDQLLDMISKQLFKQLFEEIGSSVSGGSGASIGLFAGGGAVKAAEGGAIRGPGTGRSDSIPAMLSNGEFVVNAAMAKRYGALLEAINSGKFRLPHFATGGPVGVVPRGGGFGGDMIVNIQNNGAQVETRQRQQGSSRVLDVIVAQKLNAAIAGGKVDGAMRSRFGTPPAPVRRG